MDRRGTAIKSGLVAPVIAIVGILLATLVDSSFSWMDSALSHTGELPPGRSVSLDLFVDRPSFLLFNGSLIAAGIGGLPFAWLLYDETEHPLKRSGAVTLGIALVSLAAVGIFYLPHGWHAPAAIVHFIATMGFLWLYGLGLAETGEVGRGLSAVVLGFVVLGTWLVWTFALPGAGIAVPEFVGALALAGWVVAEALRKLDDHDRRVARERIGKTR